MAKKISSAPAAAPEVKQPLRPEDFVIKGNDKSQADLMVREPITYWKDAWRRRSRASTISRTRRS